MSTYMRNMFRRLLASLALMLPLAAANAFTTGTPVENTGFSSIAPTLVITGVPAGADILVALTFNPGGGTITLTSVSDGTAYTQVATTIDTGASVNGAVFLLTNAAAGTHTITFTFSGGTAGDIFGVWISGAGALDVAHGQETNFPGTGADAVSGGSVTTTVNGDLIVGVMLTDSGTTVLSAGTSPNAFTSLGLVATQNLLETFTQTTAGAISATATQSVNADQIAFTIALKPSAGGAVLAGAATDTTTAAGALTPGTAAAYAPILLDNAAHVNGSDQIFMGNGVPGSNTGDTAVVAFTKLKQWAADINTMMAHLFRVSSTQVPTTGFSIAVAQGVTQLVLNPAGTLATGTITFPPNPGNNQPFQAMTSQAITALTTNTSDGTTLNAPATTLAANSSVKWVFQLASNAWFREQ